jgi:uncharacterized repeat protein (TIGR01451 family)
MTQDSSSNPVTGCYDTAVSYIRDGKLEIRIDYEVADLEQASGSVKRSPISFFTDPNDPNPMYLYSDRYVLLQTYTFRNLDPNTPLENLAFYQFLHSHGANEYGPHVNSCYNTVSVTDALASYIPYNSIHCAPGQSTAGDFRYDITQWNVRPYQSANHTDYVSFSSTRQPDWFDNDVYRGGHSYSTYIPPTGTHHHIENRQLNNVSAIYNDEVGGAMGWNLGTLDPNETTSLTIAFMCGYGEPDEADISLTKTDNLGAGQEVEPGDELVYTIAWTNEGQEAALNAELVDYLPRGVDYPAGHWTVDPNTGAFIPPDPNYTESSHSYTWRDLGTIPVNGSGSRSLTVVVNEAAEPGMYLHNDAVLTSSIGQAEATEDTPVACWDNDDGIIYVNINATGYNNGIDWTNAYTDLNMALDRAAAGCCNIIYVAAGPYSPGREADDTFAIPSGASVYGSFAGWETSLSQRNIKAHPTILTGIGGVQRNNTVVTMGDDSLLDGFTITGAANPEGPSYGVYGSSVDFTLANCVVENNDYYGIRAIDGNVTLEFCHIRGNKSDGIRHSGIGYTLSIHNCWIKKQMQSGVFCQNSTPYIFNSIISESDLAEAGSAGVFAYNPSASPVLHNCTFAHNRNIGVAFTDDRTLSDPNDKDYPDVQNCILWYNNAGNDQFAGFRSDRIQYSCIYDPNNPQGSLIPDVNYNISANPQFAYIDPNNVHIQYESPCRDAGNPLMSYDNQVDMDEMTRVEGVTVDMGAYEVNCEDTTNSLDWNADGLVNLVEFNSFARVWLAHDPNDPALNDPNCLEYDYLNEPNSPGYVTPSSRSLWYPNGHTFNYSTVGSSLYAIDLADLLVWIEDSPWLWRACWLTDDYLNISSTGSEIAGSAMQISSATTTTDVIGTEDIQVVSESAAEAVVPVEEQILQLKDSIEFLEQIWNEDPTIHQEIDAKEWKDFMDTVYNSLLELQTGVIQKEYLDLKSL